MKASQRVVQVCLFVIAVIGVVGGTLQMFLGQPDTTPRLDNVHRFLAGIYFGTGVICFWTALTIRQQSTLPYLIALGVFLGGVGRLVSISIVGMPQPTWVWLGYLIPELLVPVVITLAQLTASRASADGTYRAPAS